jgi:hypothetical protein
MNVDRTIGEMPWKYIEVAVFCSVVAAPDGQQSVTHLGKKNCPFKI